MATWALRPPWWQCITIGEAMGFEFAHARWELAHGDELRGGDFHQVVLLLFAAIDEER